MFQSTVDISPAPELPKLYPPTIAAPSEPLPIWRFLPVFLRNPLRTLPMQVYHEPMFVPPRMGGRLAWVTDPALVEEILLGNHENFPKSPIERRIFQPILGDGILIAEGASWRWQRRTVAPVFRHGDLMALVPHMSTAAMQMIEHWRASPADSIQRIDHDMTDLAFAVLQATIFDGASEDEANQLKRHIGDYLGHTSWDIAYEMLRVPAWVWNPARRPMLRLGQQLEKSMLAIVARARAAGWPGDGLAARLGRARDPETGEAMADGQIMNNLATFAAAGHETTAKALTWCLYLMARAPEWQAKVRREVLAIAGHDAVRAEHVEQLQITRMVLKEAMRLYPPAPMMGRKAREATTIGGHRLPAGAILVIPIFAVHRHRKLWVDADRFDPERFSPERSRDYARTQFMPFGFGPRTCIGMGFAMIEAVVLLATLVRDVAFSCDASLAPEPVSRVTLRPRHGMPLTAKVLSE